MKFHLETIGGLDGQWDSARLKQLVSNLLQNAVQHGSHQQPVTVTLQGSEEEIILTVQSMGEPVPGASLGTLFDPMVRLASFDKSRPQGSIGLGLYICREITRAHKGEIHVESTAEDGTVFTVTLPKRFIPASAAVS
jgi:signal transduction histidine kinase